MASSKYVTLVNRLAVPLQATWDGRHYDVEPGDNWLPEIVAEAAKRQNVVLGSEDPFTLACEYYVGIKEQGDDCSPMKLSKEIERVNRKKLMKAGSPKDKVEVIPGQTGLYNRGSVAGGPQSADPGFVSPDK